jgi:membrane associated rhomboid family serine protease
VIPLKDNLPTDRFPVVTVVLIAINIAVFAWQLSFSGDTAEQPDPSLQQIGVTERDENTFEYGATPYRITHPDGDPACAIGDVTGNREAGVVCEGQEEYTEAEERAAGNPELFVPLDQAAWWVTLFTSMFMHSSASLIGGLLHLGGNMLFLWVFGNNIEDSMGRLKFLAFYLAAGLVAVYSQAAIDPDATIPTIGASGAVAGVLGAYALLHPKARVLTLIFIVFFVTLVEIPAAILLAIWFVLQFVPAVGEAATPDLVGEGGVAYFAHVGGFIFGLLTVRLLARRRRDSEPALPAY